MIFVTVGAQMPFDRLVLTVDEWARARGRSDVFAQIGLDGRPPRNIEYTRFLEAAEFKRRIREARVVVAHAGMGTILSALEAGRPILVMPRVGARRETRNDHQLATAQRLRELGRISTAMDEAELVERLDQLDRIAAPDAISPHASGELIGALRDFIRAR
ncbi:MAG: glucuronosyltransferase [Myxococcales bacterium]|nr:glucuronosyltransferase [Myxococcales bacterium]